jgi:hypothetical protein
MGVLSLDFLRVPVMGKTVKSDLYDFRAGAFDKRHTGGRNVDVRV